MGDTSERNVPYKGGTTLMFCSRIAMLVIAEGKSKQAGRGRKELFCHAGFLQQLGLGQVLQHLVLLQHSTLITDRPEGNYCTLLHK